MFGISSQGFCLRFRLQPQPALCVPHGRGCEGPARKWNGSEAIKGVCGTLRRFYPSLELLLHQRAAEKVFSGSRKLCSVSEDGNYVSRWNNLGRPGSGTLSGIIHHLINLTHSIWAFYFMPLCARASNTLQSSCEIQRGDPFQMNPLIRLTDMLIKCYDAQIYGILSYQLAPLRWGCDRILLNFRHYVVNTPETAIRPWVCF